MVSQIAPVKAMPTVELSGGVMRAFASLVPTRSDYKTVPPVCIIQPLPDGRVRLFSTDSVSAVVLRADGHCQRQLAVEMPILRRLMAAHRDADVFSIAANQDEPFLRLRTFSSGQTVAIEAPAPDPFTTVEAIDGIEALGDGETGGEGTFGVLALQPLRALLLAGGTIDRVRVRLIEGNGPLVIDGGNEKEGWSARVLMMRLGAKK
jgi:hypothetical protein